MKTYQEKKIYVDDSSLEDEDWMMLRKIMRQITCCEVDEEEVQTIRREIIGMAKEARLRGEVLKRKLENRNGSLQRRFSGHPSDVRWRRAEDS